ncbi:MAG TPA: NAD(P)-dependent oxidoreductase [Edaphocola sp.]|nr:NAD(P)-dependent oxidoreductase [Edaphocola sp.]
MHLENNIKQKIKVLLTGASGTVGYEVAQQLLALPDVELSIFDLESKRSKKLLNPFAKKATIIYGNISDENIVERTVKDKDIVIHLAAIIPPLADEHPQLAYTVNVKGTQNIIKAMETFAPEALLLYSSSISVYGDRVLRPNIKVGDLLQASVGDEYALTKIECEQMIRASKLDWTIFRLAAIMGNHKISKLMFHMPLETTIEICTPKDTARAFVKAIFHKEALNHKIFNLGGGKECTTTYKEFLNRSFQIYGLGNIDFAQNSFAKKNFHCGYYSDGDDLENILKFRRDSLEDYFSQTKAQVRPWTKKLASCFKSIIKKNLERQSEPLKALKNNDKALIERFF